MVLRETAKLAFFDIRKMFDENGRPLDISKLDDGTAAALVGLEVQDAAGSDGDGFVKKYRMADKLKALELLGKRLGVFDRSSQAGSSAALSAFLEAVRPAEGEVEALYAEEDG